MQSIRNFCGKIKHLADNGDIVVITIIILVSFASFGLGRLSKIEKERTPVKIYNPEQPALIGAINSKENNANMQSGGEVVASKNGSKYYLPWCGGVKKISEANKVTFKNKEEAEKSGYTPASNCKGL